MWIEDLRKYGYPLYSTIDILKAINKAGDIEWEDLSPETKIWYNHNIGRIEVMAATSSPDTFNPYTVELSTAGIVLRRKYRIILKDNSEVVGVVVEKLQDKLRLKHKKHHISFHEIKHAYLTPHKVQEAKHDPKNHQPSRQRQNPVEACYYLCCQDPLATPQEIHERLQELGYKLNKYELHYRTAHTIMNYLVDLGKFRKQ